MGQKVHPYGFRLGVVTDWKSRWYADGPLYRDYLEQDDQIRDYLRKLLPHAAISRIEIERSRERVRVDVRTARPGIVIGRRGAQADEIRAYLEQKESKAARERTGKSLNVQVTLNIIEVKAPDIDAQLLAQAVAEQLASRVSFRRAMRKAVATAIRGGGLGVKVQAAGRLGGTEMSRREAYHEGKVPLHTLRADIDYGFAQARTTFGQIGVKVWIYKGEVVPIRETVRRAASDEAAAPGSASKGKVGVARPAAPDRGPAPSEEGKNGRAGPSAPEQPPAPSEESTPSAAPESSGEETQPC